VTADRQALVKARRIVVKVGSRTLARDPELPRRLAAQFAALVAEGRSIVLVSSGAVAIGCNRLGYATRPTDVPSLQAAASAGQSVLMRRYDEAFAEHDLTAAQVLLTHADLAHRARLNNARAALGALLEAGAIPIINENDAVATEELRVGDNDQLAAMVSPLIGADALVLLTDVAGVLDAAGERIPTFTNRSAFTDRGSADRVGSGGMQSKLEAAHKAQRSGAAVVIGPAGHPNVLVDVFAGRDVGTYFVPEEAVLRARKHWIAYTLRPTGAVLVDAGAVQALRTGKTSLLPIGVLGVRGDFHVGDSVQIIGPEGTEVGRGLTRLGAVDVARAAGKKGRDLELIFGGRSDFEIVHRDDLVLTPH